MKGIDQHLPKIYTDNKLSLKMYYWVKNPDDETYDVEAIRSRRPVNISAEDWDEQIRFWSDLKNMSRCAQNARNRAKSTDVCRHGSQTLASLRDRQGLGTCTDDQIMTMDRGAKQRRHILDVGRVLAGRGKDVLDVPVPRCNHTSDVNELKKSNKQSQRERGSARPGMMSRAIMRTSTRKRRMWIVRRYRMGTPTQYLCSYWIELVRTPSIYVIVWIEWIHLPSICVVIGADGYAYPGKGTRKPNLGGRKSGRMHTRKKTKNLGLRKITDELGPQSIRFKWKDNGTMLPLGNYSSRWANLLGEIVRKFLMHFGSWRSILAERKAGVFEKIETQFDLTPHMQSERWPEIMKGIDQHLPKIYTNNKSSLKMDYWIRFWSDLKNMSRCAQNARNRAKSTDVCRHGSRTLAALRDRQGLGTCTDDQIMTMDRGAKQRRHILGVGRVLAGRGKDVLDVPVPRCNHTSDFNELKKATSRDDESHDDEDVDEDEEHVDS
nr:hypothetical protein [Tanacetum cinerariifolium]